MILKPGKAPGEELRRLREARKLTREQFAEPLRVSQQQLKRWESEKNGNQMGEPIWLLTLITYDPLVRAQWLRSLPKGEQHGPQAASP